MAQSRSSTGVVSGPDGLTAGVGELAGSATKLAHADALPLLHRFHQPVVDAERSGYLHGLAWRVQPLAYQLLRPRP